MEGLPNNSDMKYKVTILQKRLFFYKMDLFERLKKNLEKYDIELHLVHGQASDAESVRKDEGALDWADRVKNRYFRLFGHDLCWQPFPQCLEDSDLIVLMQENSIVSNYLFLLNRYFNRKYRLAYWGHGANFQSISPNGLRERWKKIFAVQVDWWFAYTELTVNVIKKTGFPDNKITCLNNAIDTSKFINDINNVPLSKINKIKSQLGMKDDSQIGLFCGSLYAEKKLDLLVQAADLIHKSIPGFILVVIGDGPSAPQLREKLTSRPWAHCVGIKKDIEKAAFFSLAKVMLNPGLVGLHVLDSFCAGLPMVSTRTALHSPEIVYLQHGINGFLTKDDPHAYANTVIQLLSDNNKYKLASEAAKSAAALYTLDNMVANYADGILKSLNITNLLD
jgi:glycosyltransferase involved in cell wall biosynthesis